MHDKDNKNILEMLKIIWISYRKKQYKTKNTFSFPFILINIIYICSPSVSKCTSPRTVTIPFRTKVLPVAT